VKQTLQTLVLFEVTLAFSVHCADEAGEVLEVFGPFRCRDAVIRLCKKGPKDSGYGSRNGER